METRPLSARTPEAFEPHTGRDLVLVMEKELSSTQSWPLPHGPEQLGAPGQTQGLTADMLHHFKKCRSHQD